MSSVLAAVWGEGPQFVAEGDSQIKRREALCQPSCLRSVDKGMNLSATRAVFSGFFWELSSVRGSAIVQEARLLVLLRFGGGFHSTCHFTDS